MYSILAINPGHNGSVALVQDGELVHYAEEERLTRQKYDGNPMKAMIAVLESVKVDELVIGGTTLDLPKAPWTGEDVYTSLVRKYNPNVNVTYMGHLHHVGHAASAFYGSGFESAAAIVVDGAGSYVARTLEDGRVIGGFETESIYHCSYPHEFNLVYKRCSDGSYTKHDDGILKFDGTTSIVKAYEAVSDYLGFGFIEAGKTMGLASYGSNEMLPFTLLNKNGQGDRNNFIPAYPAGAFLNPENFPIELNTVVSNGTVVARAEGLKDVEIAVAKKIQKEAQAAMCELIKKTIEITGETNIVISGGFALNCVANYNYSLLFPEVNFYIDPVAHDGGTAIGLALLAAYNVSKSETATPLKSLYLGAPVNDYFRLKSVEAKEAFNIEENPTVDQVAKIITDGKIVAIFQGRAEAGPRALGNRSILFDPRHIDGKDIVNKVKGREWFRPFAGAVLEEEAAEWFLMRSIKNISPFMMYAVRVLSDKEEMIPAVTHVDHTCRVQTVNEEQNKIFYDLIKAFKELTGVPILFNTSFNLAGHPLVESAHDALVTLTNSEIDYVFFPDANVLVSKK